MLVLLCSLFLAAAQVSSTMPGFLYTRAIGRCTSQHWSSGKEAWPRMVQQESSVAKVFGSMMLERYEAELTMWEATRRVEEDAFSKLVKQASVALVNSYARDDFPYRAWEVKTLVFQALVSERAAMDQALVFEEANKHACA